VGDCVRVKGTFADFSGTAEILPMIWWADTISFDCGGGVIAHIVSIDQVATDTSPGMTGNQPGLLAKSYKARS